MTAILGISAFYHDSAAALVVDGEIVAAAQEERFSREKHDASFPARAIEYCLAEAGLEAEAIDHVAFYEKPFLKFDRILETYLAVAPAGFRSFLEAMPQWLHRKLHLPREIRRGLGDLRRRRPVFTEHHESHAASAFFPSPFEEAAILTLDGVGEWATSCVGEGKGHRLSLRREIRFPHSLGLLYSAFTHYAGFRVNSGEYKLMGLAPYGEPRYRDLILEHLVDLKDDGSYRLDMRYFNYCQGLTMTSRRFHRLFGGPPRRPESEIRQRDMDLAASVQAVTEEVLLRSARHAHELTGSRNLCLAGGVALNCVGNGRILREGPFERMWIQPAAGDAGGALGAALFVWHQLLGRPRHPRGEDSQSGSLLGPSFEGGEVEAFLDERRAPYRRFDGTDALCEHVAGLLEEGRVIGWMRGRLEFGPRALGSRSILADARRDEMQSLVNRKIKFRESFRPFAPAVLRERAHEYFELEEGRESPYMLLVAPLRESRRARDVGALEEGLEGFERLGVRRSEIPAVTHVDGSARIQTVDAGRHGAFRRLLEKFDERTGCPVLVNTSFNIRGEPIVCTPADAYACFRATDLDALVIEDCLLLKEDQPPLEDGSRREYQERFSLD